MYVQSNQPPSIIARLYVMDGTNVQLLAGYQVLSAVEVPFRGVNRTDEDRCRCRPSPL